MLSAHAIKIYLPHYTGVEPAAAVRRSVVHVRGGSPDQVGAVVEDEQRLRSYTVEALREFGDVLRWAR